MNEANHNFHQQYDKPMDQCIECVDEALARIAKEEAVEISVDDAIEARYHHHGR